MKYNVRSLSFSLLVAKLMELTVLMLTTIPSAPSSVVSRAVHGSQTQTYLADFLIFKSRILVKNY